MAGLKPAVRPGDRHGGKAGRPGRVVPRGFTLIEVAMVLAIIGLVLGALLVPLGTQIDATRYERVRAQIRNAEEALLGWAVINGRLPCPDNTGDGLPDPAVGNASAAVACTTSDEGFLPHAALGVPMLDPWGNRLRYRADRAFTQSGGVPSPAATSAVVPISVTTRVVGTTLTAPTPSAPAFIVFSCGKNGRADAANNGNTTLTATLRCGAPTAPMDNVYTQDLFTGDVFDDVLAYVDRYQLVERMTRAGSWPP